jgi:hypothetical protein
MYRYDRYNRCTLLRLRLRRGVRPNLVASGYSDCGAALPGCAITATEAAKSGRAPGAGAMRGMLDHHAENDYMTAIRQWGITFRRLSRGSM